MVRYPKFTAAAWSWVAVASWTLVIYCTIPLARILQRAMVEQAGRQVFLWIVYAAILAGLVAAGRVLRTMSLQGLCKRLPVLVVIAGLFLAWVNQLGRGAPEEALHMVEYGLLAILLFRAFSHTLSDRSVYLAALLLGAWIGTCDEVIQWLVPGRFWGLRDIGLNVGSGALVLAGIAWGIGPASVRQPVRPQSVTTVWILAMLWLVLLTGCLLNTRSALDAARARIPGYRWLTQHVQPMSEYGYLHEGPDRLSFRSRMTLDQLQAYDRRYAVESATLLNTYQDHASYPDFLKAFGPVSYPFLHEARVHLFRRDRYRHLSVQYRDSDPKEYARHLTVSFRENQILDLAFSETLKASNYLLRPTSLDHYREHANLDKPYRSPVSGSLITRVRPAQMAGLLIGGMVLVSGLCWTWRRRIAAEA